jgi:protein-tyrosine phosphatase
MKVGNLFTLKLIAQKETANLTKTKIEVTNMLMPEEPPLVVRHFHEKNWEDD